MSAQNFYTNYSDTVYAETVDTSNPNFPSFSGHAFDPSTMVYSPQLKMNVPSVGLASEISDANRIKNGQYYQNEFRDKYANQPAIYGKLPGFIIDGNPERGLTDTEIILGEQGLRYYTYYSSPWLGAGELSYQNMFF